MEGEGEGSLPRWSMEGEGEGSFARWSMEGDREASFLFVPTYPQANLFKLSFFIFRHKGFTLPWS